MAHATGQLLPRPRTCPNLLLLQRTMANTCHACEGFLPQTVKFTWFVEFFILSRVVHMAEGPQARMRRGVSRRWKRWGDCRRYVRPWRPGCLWICGQDWFEAEGTPTLRSGFWGAGLQETAFSQPLDFEFEALRGGGGVSLLGPQTYTKGRI